MNVCAKAGLSVGLRRVSFVFFSFIFVWISGVFQNVLRSAATLQVQVEIQLRFYLTTLGKKKKEEFTSKAPLMLILI